MVKPTKIIIGVNYGDEGKGLATAHFALDAKKKNKKCLNVLFNGGPQRGHTVELKNGFHHIFHHFGAGSVYYADTYFDEPFMVNPVHFVREYYELGEKGIKPLCYICPNCRVITPYDEIINQVVELARDKNKHGSCGFGIWETQKRYEAGRGLYYGDLINSSNKELLSYLKNIRLNYLPTRFRSYGITRDMIPHEYSFIFDDQRCDGIDSHYIEDLRQMGTLCHIKEFGFLSDIYDYFIFEGAQGLALDADNESMKPYVTASNTGASYPLERIKIYPELYDNAEIIYVTRSYFTRHGAGPLKGECDKELIGDIEFDRTNASNLWQGTIRYAKFDQTDLEDRIKKDLEKLSNKDLYAEAHIMITHLNEVKLTIRMNKLFERAYLSRSFYPDEIFSS